MIAKKLSPKGRSVRVTFALPANTAGHSVAIAGSFNDWSMTTHQMVLDKKGGVWKKNISFKPGSTVEFRYVIDGAHWHNENEADGTTPTPYFSENSVLQL